MPDIKMKQTMTEEEIEKRAIDQLYNAPYIDEVAKIFADCLVLDPPSKKELKRRKKEAKRKARAQF